MGYIGIGLWGDDRVGLGCFDRGLDYAGGAYWVP